MGSTPEYDEHGRARWVDEPPKRAAPHGRTPFERDRARLVHSAALRRLAAKTQVVGPGNDDFVRNRLTHTLEVAQVARDLGRTLGCDADVVETAALAHDLGHPPFGHNGERALDEVREACGGFEGNAQTLRILTRLEAKTFDEHGRSVGLNLTRATLDASTKYPWSRRGAEAPHGSHADGTRRAVKKFGVYDDDREVFAWLREGVEGRRRCIETQVMDLADDVAYSVHDLEDGIVSGKVDLAWLTDAGQRAEVWSTVRDWYLPDIVDDEMEAALRLLQGMVTWPGAPYDGSRRALGSLKDLTSELIGLFCTQVRDATIAKYCDLPLVRYAADVVVPRETEIAVAALKGVAAHYVMRADDRVAVLRQQREVVVELVSLLRLRGPAALMPVFRADLEAAGSDAEALRVVVDQVASLTDASAVDWHARLR
ncbi:deoxyguanosinetriphosphate triphosphohydrolase [soil metagenome]